MHTHYKGTGKVHSFRGHLEDGEQDEINIEGSVGAIAWRITKFEIMGPQPRIDANSTVKIYREFQSSIVETVDFNQDQLLAAAILNDDTGATSLPAPIIIFDNALFVRNIYVSQKGDTYTPDINYYIELEEVTVSAAGKAQLALAAARRR